MARTSTNRGKKYKTSGLVVKRCTRHKRRNMNTFQCRKKSKIAWQQKYKRCSKKEKRDYVSGECLDKGRWTLGHRSAKRLRKSANYIQKNN